MYTFKKIIIDNQLLLALVVMRPTPTLLNFCTILRAKYAWKNKLFNGLHPYTSEELTNMKSQYQDSLTKMIFEHKYALVDISNGEILNPSLISEEQVIGEYQSPLPF